MKILENRDKSRGGFTLVEIQIASLIVFMIFMATFALYILYSKMLNIGGAALDVYSDSRVAISLMARDIRWAAQVEPSYGAYQTSDSSIVLKVPSVDSSWNIISAQYDEVIYQLQGTDLYRIVIPSAQSSRAARNGAIAHNCTSLTFSSGGTTLSGISSANLSNINTVSVSLPINMTVLSLGGSGTAAGSITPTTTIKMRNK